MGMLRVMLLALVLTAVVGIGGCAKDSSGRIMQLEHAVDVVQIEKQEVEQELSATNRLLTDLRAELETAKATNNQEVITELQGYIDEALAAFKKTESYKATLEEKLSNFETRLKELRSAQSVGIGDELVLWGETAKDVSPVLPAPANLIGLILGTAAVGFGEMMRRRARSANHEATEAKKKANQLDFIGEDLMASVNALLNEDWQTEEEGKQILRGLQTRQTKNYVRDKK